MKQRLYWQLKKKYYILVQFYGKSSNIIVFAFTDVSESLALFCEDFGMNLHIVDDEETMK
jgi:galactitol-specific phosphotransferase system IIC component